MQPNPTTNIDAELADFAKVWRNEVPSLGLESRIERAITRAASARNWRNPLLAIGSLSATAVVAVMFVAPQSAQAQYQRMEEQFKTAKQVHVVLSWRPGRGAVSDGPLRKVQEIWWTPNASREWFINNGNPDETECRISLPDQVHSKAWSGKISHYEPEKQASKPFGVDFELKAFAAWIMDAPTYYESVELNSKTKKITVTDKGRWSRTVFTVLKDTDLPIRIEKQSVGEGGWHIAGTVEFDYATELPRSIFDPSSLSQP